MGEYRNKKAQAGHGLSFPLPAHVSALVEPKGE